jgi:hypothetical protein
MKPKAAFPEIVRTRAGVILLPSDQPDGTAVDTNSWRKTMNKILVSAAFAIALIASGNAFAASDIDESIYAETSSVASYDANGFMPSAAPMSAESAALYEESSSRAIAYEMAFDANPQLAESGNGNAAGRGWISTAPSTSDYVFVAE